MPPPEVFHARLSGKTAIVTGAGHAGGACFGTGAAIAIVLAREGAEVYVVDRHLDRAEATCAIIGERGCAIAVAADVTMDADCSALVASAAGRRGALDILVNNVGKVDTGTSVDEFDEAAWDRVIATNLKSTVLASRHAIPKMAASGGGSIVNIASIAALQGFGVGTAYAPSKAAMIALTRELAVRHGGDGIRVNAIAPGHLYTPMVAGGLDEAGRAMLRTAAPLPIEGDAWDVATAALFLASDESRFITATCLTVDGGVSAIGAITSHALIMTADRQRGATDVPPSE